MMHAIKNLSRAARRAAPSSISPVGRSGSHTHACDPLTVCDPDRFEKACSESLIGHLRALRPDAGVWYPDAFEAGAQTRGALPPRDFWTGHADPVCFEKLQPHTFLLRPGQSASAALDKYVQGPTVAECGSAIAVAQWQVVRSALGDAKFDAVFGSADAITDELTRMRISAVVAPDEPLTYFVGWGPTARTFGAFDETQAKPGDLYYIQGVPHYEMKHPDGSGRGYNVLYTGTDDRGEPQFCGFDLFPARDETAIRALLVAAYNEPRSLRAMAYIKHSPYPQAYSLRAAGLTPTLPSGAEAAQGMLPGTQRRIRVDKLIQARNMSAEALAASVASSLIRRQQNQ